MRFMFFFGGAKSTMVHIMCCALCFSFSASSSRVNTLCCAVTEGTRAVGNDSGREAMCINTEKAVDILRQDGSLWRTRHFCVNAERSEKSWSTEGRTRSKVSTNSRWIHELWIILFVRWARSTLVHVVICTRHGAFAQQSRQ